jgi:hypothetical protein
MSASFNIYQTCTDLIRPPISYKTREYLVKFITEKVLITNKIIINSNWNIIMGMIFLSEGKNYASRDIFFPKGGARTISSERTKLYELIIPLKPILDAENPQLKTIELMYEAMKIFLTRTYKKVTPELMDELWKSIDVAYLLSLPYPAPSAEQKYVGDVVKPDGEIEVLQF